MDDLRQHIEDYLLGRLSEPARLALEARLETDEDAQAEVAFQRQMRAGLAEVDRDDWRGRIQEIAERDAPAASENPPNRSSWRIWMAAASVVLLVGVGLLFWLPGAAPTGAELFAQYYAHDIQLDQARDPAGHPALVDTLKSRYTAGDFAFLQARLGHLPEAAKNRNLQLLEAVAAIELGQDDAAHQILGDVAASTTTEYADEARWLKALLHLRNDEFSSAADLLKLLANTPGKIHQEAARALLDQIPNRLKD